MHESQVFVHECLQLAALFVPIFPYETHVRKIDQRCRTSWLKPPLRHYWGVISCYNCGQRQNTSDQRSVSIQIMANGGDVFCVKQDLSERLDGETIPYFGSDGFGAIR